MSARASQVDVLRLVKPEIRAAAAYTLAAREVGVKLNQNENPYDLPADLKQKVLDLALARPWSRYPLDAPAGLIARLSALTGWPAPGILVTNGSNQLIHTLLFCFVSKGTRVVIPEPSFALFPAMVRLLGGEVVSVPLGPELEYDVPALVLAQRRSGAAATVVCSPNNPTGGTLSLADADRLCAESDGLVVLDEAYHEFVGESFVPLLRAHANLVVMRTFSKALALAGLRLGYMLAAEELVREVTKARLPFDVDFFSEAAALAALDAWPQLASNVGRVLAERDRLYERLRGVAGVKVYPSRGNFLLLEFEEHDHRAVLESLAARGVLVRDVSAHPRLARCLRVSVGTEGENAAFLAALDGALAETRGAGARS